jgi:hypothetical protein
VNAAEQARNLEIASKIATVVNLFKSEFPDGRADLKPWANDFDTQELVDPDSIDLSFIFPGWSPRFQSRCILLQIRFHEDAETMHRRAIGVEAVGFNNWDKQWRFSTIQRWEFEGEKRPAPDIAARLREICRKVLEVFNGELAPESTDAAEN